MEQPTLEEHQQRINDEFKDMFDLLPDELKVAISEVIDNLEEVNDKVQHGALIFLLTKLSLQMHYLIAQLEMKPDDKSTKH